MAEQQSLNELLKWGIENSDTSRTGETSQPNGETRDPTRGLNPEILAQLLGGPSDADRMREAMSAIVAPTESVPLENKSIAWDNFEQLIEHIDNANNMESLGLWVPLVQQLDNPEPEMRRMAAWCVSTAVQNNVKSQEKLLDVKGAIAKLARIAIEDSVPAVRKKAITALSSEVRNFQPGLDALVDVLPKEFGGGRKDLEAGDMEAVDEIIQKLRDHASST